MCDALHDLVSFLQFKKRETTHEGVLLLEMLKAKLEKCVKYVRVILLFPLSR